MNISNRLRASALALGVVTLSACSAALSGAPNAVKPGQSPAVEFQLVRNATIKLNYAGTTFLLDPMLGAKGAYAGFEGTPRSELRNPLVDLPMSVGEVLQADAVILTHLHDDHWDAAAKALVPRAMPIFTQNASDAAAVRKEGFTDVRVLTESGSEFNGTRLYKTGGQHGTDTMYAVPQLAQLLGEAMGVVFQHPGYKTSYVVGDTIWQPGIEQTLTRYQPDVVFLNTGYAQVNGFEGSIIMGKDDVARAHALVPKASLVNIHMESVNHALLSRKELRAFITDEGMDTTQVLVPDDGQTHAF